jgi:ubiquinone/menaquinone biosynthesis C-methylase UbiE
MLAVPNLSSLKRLLRAISKANTIKNNLKAWSKYDWSRYGEEWSNSPEWKESLVECILKPHIPVGSEVLEIGPGAGRWTEHLVKRASHLILVDLAPSCIEICKKRFKNYSNVEYFINDGKDISFIHDNSIDCVWSWDVFVHIQSEDIKEYVRQFTRIVRPGGQALIHHSKSGRSKFGWRSDMTAVKMREYCKEYGLEVLEQFDSWNNGRMHIWPGLPANEGPDIVSVLLKPLK